MKFTKKFYMEVNNLKIQIPLLFLVSMLWFMVWAGYNTGPWYLESPKGILDFFHGFRAFLPFFAAYLAIIFLLTQQSFSLKIFQGPLGLLFLYNLVGIISSIALSKEIFTALYWAFLYGAVLMVFWVVSVSSNPLSKITQLINFNWLIVSIVTLALLIFYLVQPGVVTSILNFSFWGNRPYETMAGAKKAIIGMPITRPTGFGRYAGVMALVALARFLQQKKKIGSKIFWFFFFLFFLFTLIFSQGKTEIFGFFLGALLIIWLKTKPKIFLFLVTTLLLLSLSPFIVNYLLKNKTVFLTLGGRTTGVWSRGWELFLNSPLLGWGFHADRIFLEGEHMHNALLHALVQTGLIGTIPFVLAFIWSWIILFKLLPLLFSLTLIAPKSFSELLSISFCTPCIASD